MTTALKATLVAALAALASATAAQAAVTVSATNTDLPLPADQMLVWDFDGLQAPGYSLSLSGGAGIYDGSDGLISGVSAPPPGTTTNYLSVLGGGKAVLTTPNIRWLSLYMGSPDNYNQIRFNYVGGGHDTLSGVQLAQGAFGGNQSVGRRMTYHFNGAQLSSVEFTSSSNSFEFDNIAAGVPEPATWAMMIMGFGMAGSAVRSSRRKTVAAVA